jgi:hypothetical protein
VTPPPATSQAEQPAEAKVVRQVDRSSKSALGATKKIRKPLKVEWNGRQVRSNIAKKQQELVSEESEDSRKSTKSPSIPSSGSSHPSVNEGRSAGVRPTISLLGPKNYKPPARGFLYG